MVEGFFKYLKITEHRIRCNAENDRVLLEHTLTSSQLQYLHGCVVYA